MLVELKQAVEKEIMLGQFDLSTLQVQHQADPHFYIKMRLYMKGLPEKDYDRVQSMLNKLPQHPFLPMLVKNIGVAMSKVVKEAEEEKIF